MSGVGISSERHHPIIESLYGLGTGVLFGTTAVIVGHPFDTIKTKMQAQTGFAQGRMSSCFIKVLKTEGVKGLYRGVIPPMLGSGIYRSTQFGVFEGVYTATKEIDFLTTPIPGLFGLQGRVILGGACGALVRSFVETPLEYIKVRRQVGQSWNFRSVYTGLGATASRNLGAVTSFFVFVDHAKRHYPGMNPFFMGAICSTIGWWIIWPIDSIKSNIQGSGGKMGPMEALRYIKNSRGGFLGLYRGILAGTLRSFTANGASFAVMSYAQKMLRQS
eukprot:Clim_evm2s9 gene=Clim_evmTU2s9